MRASHRQMAKVYGAHHCCLHVRVTNRAAYTLYKTVLGYQIRDIEKEYYADNEDAYDMMLTLDKEG
jgi:ribosomal protein S18 acetylase RimI-like enzyme